MMRRRRREAGALLGVVLVLMMVLLATSLFAYWTYRSDMSSTATDRYGRQLLDCAEQGLAVAKQYFSTPSVQSQWSQYFNAYTVCQSTSPLASVCEPNGPFPSGGTGAPPVSTYPSQAPFTTVLTPQTSSPLSASAANGGQLTYTFGIYNAPYMGSGSPEGPYATPPNGAAENDHMAIVYSRCYDAQGRSRSVQALLKVPAVTDNDYKYTAGNGMRNQGNFNN